MHLSAARYSGVAPPKCAASDPEQLKGAREEIKELLKTKFCHPILVPCLLTPFTSRKSVEAEGISLCSACLCRSLELAYSSFQ